MNKPTAFSTSCTEQVASRHGYAHHRLWTTAVHVEHFVPRILQQDVQRQAVLLSTPDLRAM